MWTPGRLVVGPCRRSDSQRESDVRAGHDKGKHIYLQKIDSHVPLTAIADDIARQMAHETVVERDVGMLDRQLEVIIGLVQLVPEEQVVLQSRASSKSARVISTLQSAP